MVRGSEPQALPIRPENPCRTRPNFNPSSQAAEQAAAAGDYASAEQLLHAAALLQEASLGPLHPDLANTLNNLAVVCEITGNPADAERTFEGPGRSRRRLWNPDHPFVATSRKNLEDFCNARGIAVDAPPAPLTVSAKSDVTPTSPRFGLSVTRRPRRQQSRLTVRRRGFRPSTCPSKVTSTKTRDRVASSTWSRPMAVAALMAWRAGRRRSSQVAIWRTSRIRPKAQGGRRRPSVSPPPWRQSLSRRLRRHRPARPS